MTYTLAHMLAYVCTYTSAIYIICTRNHHDTHYIHMSSAWMSEKSAETLPCLGGNKEHATTSYNARLGFSPPRSMAIFLVIYRLISKAVTHSRWPTLPLWWACFGKTELDKRIEASYNMVLCIWLNSILSKIIMSIHISSRLNMWATIRLQASI